MLPEAQQNGLKDGSPVSRTFFFLDLTLGPNLGAREPQWMFRVSRPHLETLTFYL